MPKWLNNAVFYEIYPQSFKDSNGDGIGDFKGIEQKLDYIKDLGCSAIWMNPCFDSPFYDAGYDVRNYKKTASRYGSNEDLKHLIDAVHDKGMKIILDLVPGHTSSEHPWFQESCKADKNEYTDRYVWTSNVWEDTDGMNALRGMSERDGSAILNFFTCQPALNYGFFKPDPDKPWQQPMDGEGPQATIKALEDIMRFWLQMGVDGFRVDMAGSLVKNDPDSKGTIQVWKQIREFLDKEFPEAVLVSEWGEPEKALEAGFDMDFQLHFGPSHYMDLFRTDHPYFSRKPGGNLEDFYTRYLVNHQLTKDKGLICFPSGNHDMVRMRHFLDEEEMKIAFTFLLTMPGAPFIYYGDEIGMDYVEGLKSKEGGYFRTGSRTPMQWDKGVNAGFSSAAPEDLYLPVNPDENRSDAASQMAGPDSLYHTIKELISLRKEHPALDADADFEFVFFGAGNTGMAYTRSKNGRKVLVVLNPRGEASTMELNLIPGSNLFSIGKYQLKGTKIIMNPASAAVFEC